MGHSAGVHVYEDNCSPAYNTTINNTLTNSTHVGNRTSFNTTLNSTNVGNITGDGWAEDCADWPRLSTAISTIYWVGVIISQGLALGGVYMSWVKRDDMKQLWLSHCLPFYNPASESVEARTRTHPRTIRSLRTKDLRTAPSRSAELGILMDC